ncbi:hypothetical protein [Aquiflexum gelatinilyticum]|uniref:Uncharacterized protein n=1 Tax=Aquiflexum gelatinilyticum TaxID=2961943 RepID=A0A9X2P571_9BACT|nr:hypothetical protein [Aquiflexum gelatinilyticum]MCR9016301.1 hypothetical protein [Aquiflexum gelatinilyticum]MCS4435607.1 hypothetical protein [Aquiflexum gelatinilyticum]
MKNELNKKAEELEQTLKVQLDMVKKESGDYIKIGGAVLAGGLVAFAAYRIFGRKKNNKTKRVLQTLEREGLLDEEIREKLTRKLEPGFLGRLSAVLLPIAVNYGREQFANKLNEPKIKPGEDAK